MSIFLNDLVLAWLAQHGVAPIPANSYAIERDGQTGLDAITAWDAVALGAQPSGNDLQALAAGVVIQQAAQGDYDANIGKGIAVTSIGTPALDATYALDPDTLLQIQGLAHDCAGGFGFPGGVTTFQYPDATGTPRDFLAVDMVNIYKAMRNLIFSMQQTLAARLQGNDTAWPTQTATIA